MSFFLLFFLCLVKGCRRTLRVSWSVQTVLKILQCWRYRSCSNAPASSNILTMTQFLKFCSFRLCFYVHHLYLFCCKLSTQTTKPTEYQSCSLVHNSYSYHANKRMISTYDFFMKGIWPFLMVHIVFIHLLTSVIVIHLLVESIAKMTCLLIQCYSSACGWLVLFLIY